MFEYFSRARYCIMLRMFYLFLGVQFSGIKCIPQCNHHHSQFSEFFHWNKNLYPLSSSFSSSPWLLLLSRFSHVRLCDPIDGSPPGSPVPGILQARTLEWVAISFSDAWKWKVKVKSLSRVRPSATPWTAAFQAPPSLGFSRQEYWSGVPLPSPSSP